MTIVNVVPDSALSDLPDRIVVAPAFGRFVPAGGMFTAEGELVCAGSILGRVDSLEGQVEVFAPCDGWVMGYMARDGQRVRPGVPLVHLRAL